MARRDDDHKMLFDLRSGRRKNLVKVVYATLAVLMGLSLFLVIGGFNIAELFQGNGTENSAELYEEQAERIEAKLEKDPDDPNLLLSLTRAQLNVANAGTERNEQTGETTLTPEAVQAYQEADQSWSEYLKATDEPSPGLAQLVAPMLLQLAELSRSYPEADSRIQAAADAQRIVAEERPSLNSWTTLSFYTYFTGDIKAAEKARAEALKLANSASERETIEKQLDEYEKNAETYVKAKEKAEKAEKASGGAGGGAPALENPLGGGLTGGGLGE